MSVMGYQKTTAHYFKITKHNICANGTTQYRAHESLSNAKATVGKIYPNYLC